VLPTGRNLSTLDPRAIPTRAAAEAGRARRRGSGRRHLQDDGDWPRRIVMDLWASPTLRSGGEDIAHALALMGVECRSGTMARPASPASPSAAGAKLDASARST
jgi:cobaltochelatase CobN